MLDGSNSARIPFLKDKYWDWNVIKQEGNKITLECQDIEIIIDKDTKVLEKCGKTIGFIEKIDIKSIVREARRRKNDNKR